MIIYQSFWGELIYYFCEQARKKPQRSLSQLFIGLVIELTKNKQCIDLCHFGYPLIEPLSQIKELSPADFNNLLQVTT